MKTIKLLIKTHRKVLNFKPGIGNFAITRTNFALPPPNMTLCVIGRVRFERNGGKMYSRRLFPYGGLGEGGGGGGGRAPSLDPPL